MATFNQFPDGFNLTGTVFDGGPPILELSNCYTSGAVQWLDTINGNNANAGDLPELPVATLAQAVTNSAANGIIIIGAGSSESLATSQALNLAGLSIWGCGSGSTRPRYTCTGSGGTGNMFDVTAAAVRIRNIYFPASTAAATARVAFTAANGEVRDCYFECGTNDTNRAVRIHTNANSCRVFDTSFVTTASRPATGLEISAAVTDPLMERVVFDGGSYGWSAASFLVSAAATRIYAEDVDLLRRSDFRQTVAGATWQLFGLRPNGTGNVFFTA